MVNGIDKKRLSQKHDKFFPFLGARIEDTNQYLIPVRKEQPDYLILIVGYIYIYDIQCRVRFFDSRYKVSFMWESNPSPRISVPMLFRLS